MFRISIFSDCGDEKAVYLTDETKAKLLYEILKERYNQYVSWEVLFETIETSDNKELSVILDDILTTF